MAQPIPGRSLPPDPRLHFLPGEQPAAHPERRRLKRGLLLIGFVGACAFGYLCMLVRVSELDMTCFQLRGKCDEVRGAIGTDLAELSGLGDKATNGAHAQRTGLVPPEGRDRILVSADLCEESAPETDAGSGAPPDERPLVLARMTGR